MSTAREKAVQCWDDSRVRRQAIDNDLVTVFAETLEAHGNEPRLGLATTEELIRELRARAEIDLRSDLAQLYLCLQNMYTCEQLEYRTVDSDDERFLSDVATLTKGEL